MAETKKTMSDSMQDDRKLKAMSNTSPNTASNKKEVTLEQVITAISSQQPVLNIDALAEHELQKRLVGINNLIEAKKNQLSFLADKGYAASLSNTQAGVVLVAAENQSDVPASSIAIVVASPYLAYASATHLFDSTNDTDYVASKPSAYVHPSAQVAPTAILDENVRIGAFCIVGDHVHIAQGTQLQTHVHIDDNVKVGENCVIYPQVYIAHNCIVGNQVRIQRGASIGCEGFGFAPTANPADKGWVRIAQLGRVIIGNGVRIGSQTCIDRGALDDTIIEDNVIIDNLVQIAHNVKIGAGTAIAASTGIAGSTHIGKNCLIGGAVGIAGHIQIADNVTLTGMSMVTKSIKSAGSYSSGTVAMPSSDWRRAAIRFRNLGKK